MGALGVLSVALTYVLGRKAGGPLVGLLAALFMAANPWLVFYDRKLWAHIQVVFSAVLLLLAWQTVVVRRGRAAFWFPVVAALQMQAHVLALVQGLSWLGAFVVAPRRWLRRETALGLTVAVVLLLPYAWALWQHGGLGPTAGGAPGSSTPTAEAIVAPMLALRGAAQLFGGDGLHILAGLPRGALTPWRITGELLLPLALLLGLGVLRTALRCRAGPAAPGARLLLAWTVGPVLLLTFAPLRPPLQYWTVLLPLPALYLAFGLEWVAVGVAKAVSHLLAPSSSQVAARSRLPPSPGRCRWSAVVVLIVVWTASYRDLLLAVDTGAGATTFGPPLKRWEEATGAARAWAKRLGTEEVRVAVDGVDPGYQGEPAAVAGLIGSPPYARFVEPSSPAALLLAHDRPSLYLWAVDAPEVEAKLAEIGERVWEGQLVTGHPPARLYRLPPASALSLGFQRLDPSPTFDAGLALIGYALPENAQADQPFQATLVWRVLDPPMSVRSRDMTAFNHILGADGKGVAQADGMALLSRDWWPGDVLIQPYSLTLPAGTYRWRTGIYSRADGGRSQLTTGGDSVDLPPFTVR